MALRGIMRCNGRSAKVRRGWKTEYQLQTDGTENFLPFGVRCFTPGKGVIAKRKRQHFSLGSNSGNDERSSSTRDAAPPFDNRLVPHPYKITVPVMAVEMQKSMVGIIWNPLDTWDGENQMLSAVFASPNWHQYQKNHALGCIRPDCTSMGSRKSDRGFYPVSTHTRRVRCPSKLKLSWMEMPLILDAIAHWNDAYGAPEPLSPPRSDEEEVLLSRCGFMQTTWDADARKSRPLCGLGTSQ